MKKASNTDLTADIVVIGAGGAGLAAAVTATDRGTKSVVVLEARNVPGGNSIFAEGLFAINGQLKEAADILNLKDRLFQRTMSFTHHRSNPRLVRTLIDEAENTLRWLQEKGFSFEWRNISHTSEIPCYASAIKAKKKTGAFIIKVLVKECQDKRIRILCNTRAKKLLTSRNGKIVGVLAEANGEKMRIYTKCVVIASGGFAGNKKLLKKYFSFYTDEIHLGGIPNQGDGIQMAAEVGADTDDTIALEMEGPAFPWTRQLQGDFTGHPYTLWVNRRGERFAEEMFNPFECANNLIQQPGKVSYTLLDEDIKNRIIKEAPDTMREPITEQESAWGTKLDRLLRMHAEKGRIRITDSLDEIAKWIGVPPTTLKATIEEYNSCCKRGHDDLFSKDPVHLLPLCCHPYYAIRCHPSLLVTHGGIKINLKMEVLDKDDNSIKGLYAAGIDTGGVDSDTYNFCLTGHSFGFALSTGRIAGKEAAKYAAKQ